jgi:UDP-galactopyranose mutase
LTNNDFERSNSLYNIELHHSQPIVYDAIVIGAGFAGAVFARKIAEDGKRVLILEKRAHIAGNMYDFQNSGGITVQKYGPHIFHTNNKKVFGFLSRFSDWYDYQHRVVGKINDKLVPIPFNFTSIDSLMNKPEADKLKTKLVSIFGGDKRISVFDLLNSDDKDIKKTGQFVLEKVFLNYTAKQWGVPIEQVDTATINRVPVVTGYDALYFKDTIQKMPLRGFTPLFTSMLEHENIEIQLNTNAKERLVFDFESKQILYDNKKYGGILFVTGAIDELLDYKYGFLPYRSLNLVFKDIGRKWYQPNAVVNYPNDKKFTRITEFKHFTQAQGEGGRTTILKEYPLRYDINKGHEAYYPVVNEENNRIYNNYRESLKPFRNVYLCGRLAEYKYYNMDAVIENALNYAEEKLDEITVPGDAHNG